MPTLRWSATCWSAASSWSQAFLDSLGGVGFAIPSGAGSAQCAVMGTSTSLSIVFSEDVIALAGRSWRSMAECAPQYAIAGFTLRQRPPARLTWTLSQPLDAGRCAAAGAVRRSCRSGGQHARRGLGRRGKHVPVRQRDLRRPVRDGGQRPAHRCRRRRNGRHGRPVSARVGIRPARGAGPISADFDGNGQIDAADYIALKRSFGRSLPAATQARTAPSVSITAEAEPVVQDVLADAVTPQPIVDAASIQPLEHWPPGTGKRDHECPSRDGLRQGRPTHHGPARVAATFSARQRSLGQPPATARNRRAHRPAGHLSAVAAGG